MRSSRISQDTAKLFEQTIAPAAAAPRRSSRRSLSRFSYSQHESPRTTSFAATITTDIEDAIAFASPPPKKRRLAASTTGTSAASSPSPPTSPPHQRRQPRTPRKPATKRTDTLTGETFISPPSEWEVTYNTVKQMRSPPGAASNAAVDSMGCERLADTKASPKTQRFHTLISLMLSSQTKDTVNAVAMHRLKTELPAHKPGAPMGLNLDNVLAVEPGVLNELIWAVGFHNNKTK